MEHTTTFIELDTTSKPAKYDGTRDGFKCLAWLKEVNRYFAMKNTPATHQTLTAVNLLGPTSLLWWDSLPETDDCAYTTFVSSFKAAYMPSNFIQQVRGNLLSAKLTSTLTEFLTRLRLYLTILISEEPDTRPFLESTAKIVFIQGCPDDLQQMLQADQVANPNISFTDMCMKAEGFDAIYAFSPKGATKGMLARLLHNNRSTPTPAAHAHDPMAMEIDNIATTPSTHDIMASVHALTVAVHAMSTRLNNQPQSTPSPQFTQSQPTSLARLTPAEKQLLDQTNGCYRCRRPNAGHFARDCGRNRPNPRAANNMLIASAPSILPGNAPSN